MNKPSLKPGKSPHLNHDPSHDVLRSERQPLEAIFAPRSVAVIGATDKPGSIGRAILWNLLSSPFGGTLFPVNPNRPNVLGIKSYPSLKEIPERVDLAVIVTPAKTVPGILGGCIDAGVRGAIVISAGFKEFGESGLELERQIQQQLKRGRLPVIGPNCLGVMNPILGLNATFSASLARPGNVAFVSQSGALCTAILDWSLREMVGFSAFVSTGSMVDVSWGDLIYYLGSDPHTHSIIIYMESIGDARSFLSAAREVAMTKPIIVVKAGRSEEASRAAASHTGALTGSDEVLDAAFRRCGALRVNNVSDLFYMAEALSKQPRPKGPKLMIVSNAGGPGVLATDALIQAGGELAELSPDTLRQLDAILPPHWSRNNPIDILGDATPERYADAMEIASKDPNCDGLLFLTAPQGMFEPVVLAEKLKHFANIPGKPVIACFMGGPAIAAADTVLSTAGIPTFSFPDTAARAFYYMWRYTYNLRGIYETPNATGDFDPDRELAQSMLQSARDARRVLLSEYESKRLLAAYGIPTVETRLALTAEEAVEVAAEIGYPVVLKLHSETITHKTDVGGIALNLKDAAAVRAAFGEIRRNVAARASEADFLGVTVQPMIAREGYELIVGSSLDAQFGPVLLFGSGGKLVEVYKDRALALPPLNTTLARRMMEQTRVYTALQGVRGEQPVDLAGLERLLVRFSQLVVEQRRIKEIDINPLLASPAGLLALDARVVLHPPDLPHDQLPRPAVRPYPNKFAYNWTMKDGTELTIRPIRPEDEPLMVKFHEKLSERSVYLRYFQPLKLSQRVAHERLTRICFIDYDREMAMVAVRRQPDGSDEIYAVGRLSRLHWRDEAEIAVLVRDEVQRRGLGRELTERLVKIAREEGVRELSANILAENVEMQTLAEKVGFRCHFDEEEGMVRAEMQL
jgi:acetyltransferase